jgi:asparagine synthase (glutamine-hydrolysing)
MAYKDKAHSPYDETQGVEALIEATGWSLNRLDLTAPDLLKETAALLAKTRAPVITVTWLAHYVLARAAREAGNLYLFSGLGGDESLAGEFEHFFLFFADLFKNGQAELLAEETRAWAELHDHPVFKKDPEVRDDWFRRNLDFATGTIKVDQKRYQQYRQFFNPEWVEYSEQKSPPVPMPTPYPYFLSNRLYQEMTYETSPPTLWSEALSSRAGGIKGIFPMASPALFRLALSLPGTFKYKKGLTKWFLREAVQGLLPDSSRLNPVKTGFNAPLDLWLREYRLANEVLELLTDGPLKNKYWLKKGAPEQLVTAHLKGEANYMMVLWPLIVTSLFLEQN